MNREKIKQLIFKQILRSTQIKKVLFFLILDILIIIAALYFSFLLRFDFDASNDYFRFIKPALPFFILIKLLCFLTLKLYRLSWRFVSFKDLLNIIKAVFTSSLILMLILYFLRLSIFEGFPRGILIIDALITLLLMALLRISKRFFLEAIRGTYGQKGRRTIIIGGGNTGEMILRDIQKSYLNKYNPVAILDDDSNLTKTYLHGIKIIEGICALDAVIKSYRAEVVIIAIPSLRHGKLREIHKTSKEAGIKEIKIVPQLYNTVKPEIHVKTLDDLKIEDLIGRQVVKIDYNEIGKDIIDKTVMITGAAGSIGFELTKQICNFNPKKIILFEIDETELFNAQMFLRRRFPELQENTKYIVGDIYDTRRTRKIFQKYKPEIVFHAAAYKHVPMMEHNASEAVKINILGTNNLAKNACEFGGKKFIMISTDKAVRPTSIMGATKRVAEFICQTRNSLGMTEFISVRFGNVLGSRGSVLPLFLDQIKHGGPLTVTHKDIKRYFMTIPEAVSLVLQASTIGRGSDIMVLDMGKPIKIIDLAEELLRINGLRPYQDIDIKFTGLRPGEKMFEEILTAEEGTKATRHEQIFIANNKKIHTIEEIEKIIAQFQACIESTSAEPHLIKGLLKQHVPWYENQTKT